MRRLRKIARRFCWLGRPLVVWHCLIALSLGTVGVPVIVWKPIAGKPSEAEGAYPCRGHACGCDSSKSFWKSCCCYTPQQRLDWAKSNGITPPNWFLEQHAVVSQSMVTERSETKRACCSGEHASEPVVVPEAATQASSEDWSIGYAIGDLTRKCRGLSPLRSILSAAVCVPFADFSQGLEPIFWLEMPLVSAVSQFLDPPVPPPRQAV